MRKRVVVKPGYHRQRVTSRIEQFDAVTRCCWLAFSRNQEGLQHTGRSGKANTIVLPGSAGAVAGRHRLIRRVLSPPLRARWQAIFS